MDDEAFSSERDPVAPKEPKRRPAKPRLASPPRREKEFSFEESVSRPVRAPLPRSGGRASPPKRTRAAADPERVPVWKRHQKEASPKFDFVRKGEHLEKLRRDADLARESRAEWEATKAREDEEKHAMSLDEDWKQRARLESINKSPSGTYHKTQKPDWNNKHKDSRHGRKERLPNVEGGKKRNKRHSHTTGENFQRASPPRELGYYGREGDDLVECL